MRKGFEEVVEDRAIAKEIEEEEMGADAVSPGQDERTARVGAECKRWRWLKPCKRV